MARKDADRKGGGPRYELLLAPAKGHAGERLTAHRGLAPHKGGRPQKTARALAPPP